jgi:hypothetical protein
MKHEVLLQISLGHSLRASEGWCAHAVKEAYTRALRLSRESGLEQLALPAMFGLGGPSLCVREQKRGGRLICRHRICAFTHAYMMAWRPGSSDIPIRRY